MALNFRILMARYVFKGKREDAYRTIANSMLKDGVPLKDCIIKLANRAEKDRDSVAPLYRAWVRRMGDVRMKGEFTACIKPDIPNGDYMVLRGFERSGKLAEGILYQSTLIGRLRRMKSEFTGALVKPVISLLAIIGVSAFFSKASRGFLDTSPMEKWPLLSQYMFKTTIFIDENLYFILGTSIFVIAWLVWAMSHWGKHNIKMRHWLDKFQPFVMYRDFTSFSTMIVLASLMSSGMPLKVAAKNILESGNLWIKSYFRLIVSRLGDARIKKQVEALDVGFFPKNIFYRIIDSSEQGDFDSAIRSIAEDSFESMERDMKKRAFALDQSVMIVTGSLAGLIAGGLASAVGAVTSIIKGG